MNVKPIARAHATNTAAYIIPHQALDSTPSPIDFSFMNVAEQAMPKERNMAPQVPAPSTAPSEAGSDVEISTAW
jgi:hypothetical protein